MKEQCKRSRLYKCDWGKQRMSLAELLVRLFGDYARET